MPQPIVSYHPSLKADIDFLLRSQRPLDRRDAVAVAGAAAVLLPQICRPDLYQLVAGLGKPCFPRAAVQTALDGKVGNHRLFKGLGLPRPPTAEFTDLASAAAAWRADAPLVADLGAPLVAKGAGGGQGVNVFLVHTPDELEALEGRLDTWSAHGPAGLVLQRRIEHGGRDLRVEILGGEVEAYWRVGREGSFNTAISAGGRCETEMWPEEMARGVALARRLARLAGIDSAGVDVLLPPGGEPLLLEVNFFFGRRALGGRGQFMDRYLAAVRAWLSARGLDPERVGFNED